MSFPKSAFQPELVNEQFKAEVEAFLTQLDSSTSGERAAAPILEAAIKPFSFDPNNLSLEGWMRLGLTKRQSQTILNYRSKGGNFRVKSDLKKMYVVDSSFYTSLFPFIQLPEKLPSNKKQYKNKRDDKTNEEQFLKFQINTADTLMLQRIRGIGPVLSKRLVRYREALGGFVGWEQLNEVYGLKELVVEELKKFTLLDTIQIRKININSCSAEDLQRHPYVNWNLARALINRRTVQGNYQSVEEIKASDLVNEELYFKIAPYLTLQ